MLNEWESWELNVIQESVSQQNNSWEDSILLFSLSSFLEPKGNHSKWLEKIWAKIMAALEGLVLDFSHLTLDHSIHLDQS